MLTRKQITNLFGEDWTDFMAPFVQSKDFDAILEQIKADKEAKKVVYPDQSVVFAAFKSVPLSKVRVVIIGQDPYPVEGYATGLAFGHPMTKKIAKSLEKVIDAVEVDCYNGLEFDKNKFNTELTQWAEQGVLLLNASLTVVKDEPGSHSALWQPFATYVIDHLSKVKRDLIFLSWGKPAQMLTEHIHFVKHFTMADEHPANAAREKREWKVKCFSFANACIIGNGLGEPIKW